MINWDELEEKARRGVSLTAEEAAVPAYLKSQAEGVEAAGDIFGIATPSVTQYKEGQEEALSGFESQYPEGLFKTDDPVGWWKETATLNAMNQVVPYLGYTAGALLQAVPHPVAKILGAAVNTGTFATQYNANFADTLQEHEERAGRPLTDDEKVWAGIVSGGVVALDRLVPGKMAKDVVKKMGGKGGVETARKSLIKRMNAARDSLGTSLRKGGKYVGAKLSQEALTEAAQKSLQIGTSKDPGYLATTEGLQSIGEEAAVAGPTAGILSTPGAALEGTAVNRDIAAARRQAQRENVKEKQRVAGLYETEGKKETANLITIPESAESILSKGAKKIEQSTGLDVKKLGEKFADIAAFRPTTELVKARDRQTTGEGYSLLNRIIQKFVPTGSYSQETGLEGGQNFLQRKDKYHGQYYKDINEILNRYTKKRRGQLTAPRLSDELNEHIANALENRSLIGSRPDLIKTQDLKKIADTLNIIGGDLQTKTGSGFVENYLTRPLSQDSVTADKNGFIQSLVASSKIAYDKAKGNKDNFIYQPNDAEGTRRRAEIIADDIIQGRDPFAATSQDIRRGDKKDRKGKGQENFEKSRSKEWENLDKAFRERDINKVLEQYASKAATRVASAETFGSKNADELQKTLSDLVNNTDITGAEVDRVWDMYDAVHGVYRRDVSPGEAQWRLASKALTTVGAITHLGFATLSSLPELVWIAERAGFSNMLATLPQAFKYTTQGVKQGISGKNMDYTEGNKVLANLGFNLNPAMNERLDQMFATDRNAVLSMYFRSPFGAFLTQWTNFNRNWAALAGMSMMNRRAKALVTDSLDPMDKRRMMNELKEMGISLDEFKQLASLSKDADGNININMADDNYLNTKFTKDNGTVTDVRSVLHPYVYKIVNDIVINPVATNKPMWMSDPSLATIAQLKTFPIVFGNTVVKRLLRKLKPNQCSPDFGLAMSVVGAIASAMAVAYIGEQLKQSIRGQDKDLSWVDLGNTAGLFGPLGMIAGGKFGDFTTTLLGPALDGAINKTHSELINPFLEEDGGGFPDASANLNEWGMDAIISSMGIPGEVLFDEEEK